MIDRREFLAASAACAAVSMTGPVLAYEGREDQGGGEPRPAELRAAVLPGLTAQLYAAAAAAEG